MKRTTNLEKDSLLFRELSYEIIGAAIEVHKVLGHGFLESVYQAALCVEFDERHIAYQQQVDLPVDYKGKTVGIFRADFIVDQKIIVELKSIKHLTDADEAQ